MAKRGRRQNNKGMTLIELIITFSLLSLFMAVGTAIIIPYYQVKTRIENTSYCQEISSIIFDSVRSEISSAVDYVKLRDRNGTSLSWEMNQGGIEGEKLEFIDSAGYVKVIHALGGAGYQIQNNTLLGRWKYSEGHVCFLTYVPDPENGYKEQTDAAGLEGAEYLEDPMGTIQVARAAVMDPAEAIYKGYTAEVSFTIPSGACEQVSEDSSSEWQVHYLQVTIYLKEDGETVYKDSEYIEFLNPVLYKEEATSQSD